MSKALIVLLLMGILFFAGCASQGGVASQTNAGQPTQQIETQKPAELQKSVCGNGIKETGETSDNCCKDAGCPDTFKCQSKFEGNETLYFCKKILKEETYEAGKIKTLMEDISLEINKENDLRDYSKAKSKLSDMDALIQKLKALGYDVNTEEFLYKAAKARTEVSEVRSATYKDSESMTFEQQKAAVTKDLEDLTAIVSTLENLKSQYSSNLKEAKELYGYDIDENLDAWKSYKKADEELKLKYEKGIGASLSILDLTKSCTRYSTISDSAYLSALKLSIENTGGFDFSSPVVDIKIYSGDTIVSKNSENLYKTLVAGTKTYNDLSLFNRDLKCDTTYKLTAELRDGADPKVYASTSTTFKIS